MTASHPATLLAALAAPAASALPPPFTMVVAAHPDDETVSAGSRLQRLRTARFVCVTDGAPRDGRDAATHGLSPPQYAATRRRELEAALALCGIGAHQIESLGCPDQEASLHLAPLALRVADLLVETGVEAVLTHAYEGGHPDHDATAFIAHAAVALTLRRGTAAAPAIVEMTSYHRSPEGTLTAQFLPSPQADAQAVALELTPQELAHKRALVACHATQRETLSHLPLQVERFRPAPRYDFTRPPHEWKLHYEYHPWGMTGARFVQLAAQALQELELEGPL